MKHQNKMNKQNSRQYQIKQSEPTKRRVKRVSFEKERDQSGPDECAKRLVSPGLSLPSAALKPATKSQTNELDCSAPQFSVLNPTAPASQHEETGSSIVPVIRRRRIHSMPAGSTASQEFFGVSAPCASSTRMTCLDPLEILHEDKLLAENKRCDPSNKAEKKALPTQVESTVYNDGKRLEQKLNAQPKINVGAEKSRTANCNCNIL